LTIFGRLFLETAIAYLSVFVIRLFDALPENGMPAETLKSLGGWKSDSVPQRYVDLTVRSRIEMSKMLQKKF